MPTDMHHSDMQEEYLSVIFFKPGEQIGQHLKMPNRLGFMLDAVKNILFIQLKLIFLQCKGSKKSIINV